MEESSQQRHIQKEEFKHNPEESAIVSFLGNDPQTNKKWIQYNSSQIRHGYYVSNGAIARGTVPETYQSTDSTQAVIDWKPYYPVPFPDIEESENNDELTTHCIFLVLKSTYTPLPIFLIKKNSFAADSIFLVKKNAVKRESIFLIKKGSLKAAYVVLLELQTEYVYIYNKELHSCDRIPISEIISGQKTYADYEQCKEDNLHCTGGPGGGGSGEEGSDGLDPSVLIADSIAANHEGWNFTFYFAISSQVKDMLNPASIWYNGGIVWDISVIHSGGQSGEAIDVPPSTKTITYVGGGNKYKSNIEYQQNSAMQSLPCEEIATNNLREYTINSGIYLSVEGGSKGSVVNAMKSRPLLNSMGGDSEYTCVDHGYFFSSFRMAPTGTATTSEVFPYLMTGYLAQISTSQYNKPGTNKFFPGDGGNNGGGGNGGDRYYYCGNPPVERKGIWLEYVLFFEGKQFNTGVSIKNKDVISSDYETYINTLNSHKFVIGVTSDEIFLRIWNKAIWQNINSGSFVYSLATTFLLNRSDLSVKSKTEQNAVTENVAIDYRFFHTNIQSRFSRWTDSIDSVFRQEIGRDIWEQAFIKIDQNIIDVPYNFTYGYYSSNLIKGTMDNSVVNNPDVILDVFFINPSQLINGKTWKEHIIKSNQDAANVNIVVTVTKYRRIQVSSGQFFSIKQTRTEKIVNLMRGLGISDNEQYNIARIAGVVVYV